MFYSSTTMLTGQVSDIVKEVIKKLGGKISVETDFAGVLNFVLKFQINLETDFT